MSQYLILIYEDEKAYAAAGPRRSGRPRWRRTAGSPSRSSSTAARSSAARPCSRPATATSHPRRHRHRRPVRRDQGGAGRLLPDRGGRPRPGARDREALPGAVRRRRGPADHGHLRGVTEPGPDDGDRGTEADVEPRSPTRTVASGPSCSPRRCASTGDLDLAEECVQDAYGARTGRLAPRTASPRSPGAWLTTAARRRALDVLRREQTLRAQAAAAGRADDRRPGGRRPRRTTRRPTRSPTTGCAWSSPAATRRWPGRPRSR